MRPAKALEGLIEVRGTGIVRLPYEPVAVACLVIDLDAPDLARLPQETELQTQIGGVTLTRLAVAPGGEPLARLRAYLFLKALSGGQGLTQG
jgi:serine kinase of HPr protein (carbohydrate metabolism regulator)